MASPGSGNGNGVPSKAIELKKQQPMNRPGVGRDGRIVKLVANHFRVKFDKDAEFYHYNVSIKFKDNLAIEAKGFGRKVIDKLYDTYKTDLGRKNFAYDGEKSLFTVGSLRQNNLKFEVVLGESSPSHGNQKQYGQPHQLKTFIVEINYAAKIPMQFITEALKGQETEHTQDALRVLNIILRQQQAKRGCLLVRQSFFNDDESNLFNLGGGVIGCRGLHSSFRTTRGGLSLNMDVSTTTIMRPGPVQDFLIANQDKNDIFQTDWAKAKRMLKNMRIITTYSKKEFKIIGLSELPCNQQLFSMKVRDGRDNETENITVYDYFHIQKNIKLTWSASLPCLDVGKPKRPNYLPLELCELVPLQRYTKALSSQQRASLVGNSRQRPEKRVKVVTDAVERNRYTEDPVLKSCGISIEKCLTMVEGRILVPPRLRFDNSDDAPRNGRWNFNNKRVFKSKPIKKWAVVNFSARCNMSHLSWDLIKCGEAKGIVGFVTVLIFIMTNITACYIIMQQMDYPFALVEENQRWKESGPTIRVEKMFEQLQKISNNNKGGPQETDFILCILPERKNSDIYGPWKRKNLHDLGIVTQCIAPIKLNDQYLTNVLLKINAKLGGVNSLLNIEYSCCIPFVNVHPTLILGMDVSHGSPGRPDMPSIAAVVGSRYWPQISRYGASVRTQSPKVEMIDGLYKPQNGEDCGIIRERFFDFYVSTGKKPTQVIIFRDGVGESQFNQVLNIELVQICKAFCDLEGRDDALLPKFTVIVAQKRHHTRLFLPNLENVQPGTVVDTQIVHPQYYDFYMCAHAGMIGTSRPTHYIVLLDEIGFPPDDLQKFVHSLSYVYQRSTSAISIVAPIMYAHLAAAQMSQLIKLEDFAETMPGQGGAAAAGVLVIPEIPQLHDNVRSSMFFC